VEKPLITAGKVPPILMLGTIVVIAACFSRIQENRGQGNQMAKYTRDIQQPMTIAG
jgi:hypothetical protein